MVLLVSYHLTNVLLNVFIIYSFQGICSSLIPIFEPMISPRNMALVAVKGG